MKIHFTAGHSHIGQSAFAHFTKIYGQVAWSDADFVVALGGDGHVLRMLYEALEQRKPIFPMRRTESIGFLCNDYSDIDLEKRLAAAQGVTLHPLRLEAMTADGTSHTASAINEISVLRETPQAARLRVLVDGIERIAKYSGDGILVSTPAGSTAYNHSCGGPIMPLDANTLIVTAICGFRPRGWKYAVLQQSAQVEIEALESSKRPIKIECGMSVIHGAVKAKIWLDRTQNITLLFDPEQHLGERILREQFML
jgi:NAD+ kinase